MSIKGLLGMRGSSTSDANTFTYIAPPSRPTKTIAANCMGSAMKGDNEWASQRAKLQPCSRVRTQMARTRSTESEEREIRTPN